MERRGFLRTSFLGGLAVGGAACASNDARRDGPAPLSDAELERTMRHLDRALAGVRGVPSDWYVTPEVGARMTRAQVERARMDGELLRSSLRSMLVTSTVAELPKPSREDPRVLARLQDIVHEADFAALGTVARLQALTPEDLRSFDEELRRNPDFIAEVVDLIDEQAAAHEVSPSRRRHLRAMARHLATDLRRDSSEKVVERTLRQAQRVMLRHETMDREMTFAEASTPEALRWAALTTRAVDLYEPPNSVDPFEAPPSEPAAEQDAPIFGEPAQRSLVVSDDCACHPADMHCVRLARCHQPYMMYKDRIVVRDDALHTRRKGGVLLGVGIALIIPGAVFAPFTLGITGFAVTAGVIMLIIGIVFMVRAKRQLQAMYST